jgi:hypothetical protein
MRAYELYEVDNYLSKGFKYWYKYTKQHLIELNKLLNNSFLMGDDESTDMYIVNLNRLIAETLKAIDNIDILLSEAHNNYEGISKRLLDISYKLTDDIMILKATIAKDASVKELMNALVTNLEKIKERIPTILHYINPALAKQPTNVKA